jgi:hypothetical protein
MFGSHNVKPTKPIRDMDEPEVEAELRAIKQLKDWALGARCVRRAPPGKAFKLSDGTTTTESWRTIACIEALPYDIAIGPETSKEHALTRAHQLGQDMGGEILSHVKGADA